MFGPFALKRLRILRAWARVSPSDRGPTDWRWMLPVGLGQFSVPGIATTTPALAAGAPAPPALVAVTTHIRVAPSSRIVTVYVEPVAPGIGTPLRSQT